MSDAPRIALTMGDPAGVGPELCCRACADPQLRQQADIVVIGSRAVLRRVATQLALPVPAQIEEAGVTFDAEAVVPGVVAAANGAAAASWIEHAVAGCLAGRYAALTTAPIHKAALAAAGVPFPGHTELLAARCGLPPEAAVMMLYAPEITVALVTCHQSLASVPGSLRSTRIEQVGRSLWDALSRLHGREPRLAMLGLNPHAGEHGLFGHDERDCIEPAVATLRRDGLSVDGPLPPDTAFTAAARARYDGWICQYHDQGLIPFKALAFAEGVNVSLGLPVVRTSVDHGTAFDIAWQGLAEHGNMMAALRLALRLSQAAARPAVI